MTDRLSQERRSANMRAVRGSNTTPEVRGRQIAHRLGYWFRLHRSDLPGTPDILFPGRRRRSLYTGVFGIGTLSAHVRAHHTQIASSGIRSLREI